MQLPNRNLMFRLAIGCLGALGAAPALAQTQTPAAPAAPAPPAGLWIDGVHFGLQLEGGFTANPANPANGVNFGELFNDRANQPQLNQLMLTINKPTDPNAKGFDWGFKLQGMYGSDARYTHSLGVFDMNPGPGWENQFDVTEAAALLHIPGPTAGGTDVTAGLYPTPLGYEVIDPSGNPFYSHSYVFSFGLPLKHTGVMATTHVSPLLDIYYGIDTGANTTFVQGAGDDTSAPAGLGGFGLNMMGGNLTVLALTHIGPENSSLLLRSFGYDANDYLRYYNDIVVTWKASDKLTLTTEANWVRDDFDGFFTKGKPSPANAFGVAQYLSYALSSTETLNVRAEVYRDDNGFFTGAFPNNAGLGNNNFAGVELGLPGATSVGTAPVGTTYGELTIGMTFKPDLPAPITGLLIRPELRVDHALSGGHPFGTSMNASSQITIASDFVLTF